MKERIFKIKSNKKIAKDVYRLALQGNTNDIKNPGSFVQLKIDNFYLRRPISVCDVKKNELILIYKIFGKGTKQLTKMNNKINILTGLGNGFDLTKAKNHNLLIGGGVGVPPLYLLAKRLIKNKKDVTVILAFNSKDDVFYEDKFAKLGAKVIVATIDGSKGKKGYAHEIMKKIKYDYVFACGPLPMLKAIYNTSKIDGQYSLEERMGCGFGACLGCTIQTKSGTKQVCQHGPVFEKGEIIW